MATRVLRVLSAVAVGVCTVAVGPRYEGRCQSECGATTRERGHRDS